MRPFLRVAGIIDEGIIAKASTRYTLHTTPHTLRTTHYTLNTWGSGSASKHVQRETERDTRNRQREVARERDRERQRDIERQGETERHREAERDREVATIDSALDESTR
jgi:hypothetical protein